MKNGARVGLLGAAMMLAVGCGNSGDSADLVGNWDYLNSSGTSGVGLTFTSSGTYVLSIIEVTSSTSADAQVEKAQLQQEVAELQATHDAWVKAGMLGKLDQCGPKRRPCIRVDESAGPFGERLDYRVILGY